MSQSQWSPSQRPQQSRAAADQFRNYGPSRAQPNVDERPSLLTSAFGSFAIDFVVSRIAAIALGTLLVGVLIADSGSAEDVDRHLTAGVIVIAVGCSAAGALAAGMWLSRRRVARPFLVAGAGAVSGAAIQNWFNFANSESAGTVGLLLASVVELAVTYAVIRSTTKS